MCGKRIIFFLPKFVASGRYVVAKKDIAVGEVILRNINTSTSSRCFSFTKNYIMINLHHLKMYSISNFLSPVLIYLCSIIEKTVQILSETGVGTEVTIYNIM